MDIDNKHLIAIKNTLLFFAGVLALVLISLLKTLLIPLVLALFIALLMQPILAWLYKKKIPTWAGVGIIWILLMLLTAGIDIIIYSTITDILENKELYLQQINQKLADWLALYNKITKKELDLEGTLSNIMKYISSEFILSNSGSLFGAIGSIVESIVLTAVYLIIFLSGIMQYETYLHYLGGEHKSAKYIVAFEEVKSSIVSYMKVKFIISLIYGIGTALVCYLFDLQLSFFWGFIGFVFNFLPVVGAIAGLIPVLLMAIIQFDTIYLPFVLILVIYVYHALIATILEPYFLGQRTSLNIIAVIMGLLFWGYLWGIYGMFLSVPLMVLTKVIISQFEGTEVIVRLLGTQKK